MGSTCKLVVDTDTAADDAIALLMAARSSAAELVAVTTIAGNVPVDLAARNAAWALALGGDNTTPVYLGAAGPMRRELVTGQDVHGKSGMGDAVAPQSVRPPSDGIAAIELVEIAKRQPGELTLVTLGPLTNIAIALLLDPAFLTRFERVVVMGGAPDAHGNITAVAEYNFWADPEAADLVLGAEGSVQLVGWDISRQAAVIGDAEKRMLAGLDTAMARFALAATSALDRYCRDVQGIAGFDLPDPVTMAIALDPAVAIEAGRFPAQVITAGDARGQLVLDRRNKPDARKVTIVQRADRAKFLAMLEEACR